MSRERGSWFRDRISELVNERTGDLDAKDAFIKHLWSEVDDDYQKMADDLATACKEELKNRRIPAVVESRVKSRASITKSLERREIHRQPRKQEPYRDIRAILQDLHDLVGIRIIVDYLDHMKLTSDFVADTFHQEKDPNIFSANRKVGHSWTSWFGAYECTNHHVSAKYQDQDPLSYYNGVIFEIQVTSLPANLYNKIAHPLLYKEEAGQLSQGDEMVVDLTKGLAYCYSLCTYYKRYKIDGKAVDTCEMELMKNASSATEGPEFESSINHLAGRMPGVDTAGMKGKSIPRETLELVLGSLLNNDLSRDIGQCLVDKLRREIQDISRPRIELHAFGKARFDSQDVFQSPICQEGTQVGARNVIHNWVENGKEPLLWICSHAGTGKSTLARTISRDLTKTGRIAAGYFFRRGDVGRNYIRHVIPTIAAQFILTIPQYESYLRESIDACKNTDFENMVLYDQFKVLLKSPLSQVGATHSTKIIIIDALDECVDLAQVDQVIDLLIGLKSLVPIRFRILITSRDEDLVREAIARHGHEKLLLATAYHNDNISDIESILKVGFQKIRTQRNIEHDWPTEEQFQEVVQRSTSPSPLFIYATTLLRFLGDGTRLGIPKKRLQSWIEKAVGSTFTTQLDEMYTTVFENLDPDLGPGDSENLTEDEKNTLRMILGAIALAAEPLSVNSLSVILGLDLDVLELLKSCRAVLYVPDDNDKPVQMLHKSFSDFILNKNPKRTCWFHVDEKRQHESLAARCINHLGDKLSSNICHLQDPAVLRVKIEQTIIQKYIPNSLQYASTYWGHHLQNAGASAVLSASAESFLRQRFLQWIECLAIIGQLSAALITINGSLLIIQPAEGLRCFLNDPFSFLLKHGPMIQKAPRQTYGSALLFSPRRSIIRNSFWDRRLSGCHNARNVPEDWGFDCHKIRLASDNNDVDVVTIALSPNGELLASCSCYYKARQSPMCFIEIWLSGTGTRLARAALPSIAKAICWAKNEKRLMVVAESGDVYIYDFLHERPPIVISSRPFEKVPVKLAAISPTGVVAMAHSTDPETSSPGHGNSCQISVWDSITGRTLHVWMSMIKVSAIAISFDSSQVALVADGTVKLLDTKTQTVLDLSMHSSSTVLAFSTEGERLFVLNDASLARFPIQEGCFRTLPLLWDSRVPTMFSLSEETSIAALYGDEVWLWSIQQNTFQHFNAAISEQSRSASIHTTPDVGTPLEEFSHADQIAMSPDGQYLVSRLVNRLHLWRLPEGEFYKLLTPKDVPSFPFIWNYKDILSFSRDGSAILASCNYVVYVWVLETAKTSDIQLLPIATISFGDSNYTCIYATLDLSTIWMTGKKAAILAGNRVEIWDFQDGSRRLHTFRTPHQNLISTFAFAPGPDLLAIAYGSDVSILSASEEASIQTMAVPLTVTRLSFSPDGSMLLLSCSADHLEDAMWAAAVYGVACPTCHDEGYISTPVRCLPLGNECIEARFSDTTFIYPDNPHSSALGAWMFSFSTDGRFVKLRLPGKGWYNIQHARHVPPASEGSTMICEMHRPNTQSWIRRGNANIIQMPEDFAWPRVVYGGRHVAMIDRRRKIILLEFD